jgi:uncharacterized delta-60 repeat protein
MVATFSCRDARRMRPLAVATNLAFIGYGLAASLPPVLALHALLLLINLWRWAQLAGIDGAALTTGVRRAGGLLAVALLLVTSLAGCGGGDGDGDGAVAPGPATIGPAGGTVRHASGAEVVMPAGALTGETTVQVEEANSAAPPLPADLLALGPVYAFTPHGTRFATPATVVVPFDRSLLPLGATPQLYKAEAGAVAGDWRAVGGASARASSLTAEVGGFSYFVVAVPGPLTLYGVFRNWEVGRYEGSGRHYFKLFDSFSLPQNAGDLHFALSPGAVTLRPPEYAPQIGDANKARLEVTASASGMTYAALAEAPSDSPVENIVGGRTRYEQHQSFRRNGPNARLRYVITKVWMVMVDDNPIDLQLFECPWMQSPIGLQSLCPDALQASLVFSFDVIKFDAKTARNIKVVRRLDGLLWMAGTRERFRGDVGSATSMAWDRDQFDFSFDRTGPSSRAEIVLKQPIVIDVPLDDLEDKEMLAVRTTLELAAFNHRRRESYVGVFFRDPAAASGSLDVAPRLEVTGLEAVPVTFVPGHPVEEPALPPCTRAAASALDRIGFEKPRFEARELPGMPALVALVRSGSLDGEASVRLRSRDGSATDGNDYRALDQRVHFRAGEARRTVPVDLVLDDVAEADETLSLDLSEPQGCASIDTDATAQLTIVDDDRPPPAEAAYRVGGTVSGLAGRNFVLEDRAQAIELLVTADGSFEFNRNYASGAAYDVQVKSPPVDPAQVCTVLRGSGTVAAASVADIEVRCTTPLLPGALDPGFGTLGKVAEGLPGGAIAIGRQSTGHIVAVNGARLVRYDADGKLDRTFGGGRGIVDSLLVGTGAEVSGMAIGPDDRIVVAGRILQPALSPPYTQMAAARFLPDGTRDTSFGSAGQATFRLAGIAESAARVLVQPDGRVLLLGQMTLDSGLAANNNIALVRLLADGSFDTGFGTGGAAMFDATKRDFPQAALLQPDGRIVIGGKIAEGDSEPSDSFFGRVDAAGAPEAGFGRSPSYSTISDEVVDMALQPDGRIVLLVAARGVNWEIMLARINADGSPDTGFGTQGLVRRDVGPHDDWPRAVAVQADGRIVVAAQVSNPLPMAPSFALLRFEASGAPDPGFGTDGVLRVPFFGSTDNANDLLLQPDGKIVAAGSARSGLFTDIAMVRVMP